MGFISKSYLQTQFTNFATRLSLVFAKKTEIPTKVSELTNDNDYLELENGKVPLDKIPFENNQIDGILIIHGLDADGKRTGYKVSIVNNASGVNEILIPGASGTMALTKDIPTKMSQLTNDSNYVKLDNGTIPAGYLPSYVNDVMEGYIKNNTLYMNKSSDGNYSVVVAGESDKIYVDLDTNKTYRWSGSKFVVISDTIALGETSSTAYRGDRGKTAYDHSQSEHAPSNAQANVQSDWNATSGDAYIKNKPTIPSQDTGNIDFSTYFS